MYSKEYKNFLASEIDTIKSEGLYKQERILTTPQGVEIETVATSHISKNAQGSIQSGRLATSSSVAFGDMRIPPMRLNQFIFSSCSVSSTLTSIAAPLTDISAGLSFR